MKKIELQGLERTIFVEKLPNGLQVILIPFPDKKDYYISYATKYGSVDLEFTPPGEKKVFTSPMGVAHFLEHQMFEQENQEDPMLFFAKSGTSCNAGTSYKKTVYFIYGIHNLQENLNHLINFVNEPFFTKESIEIERGIILEELRMYRDDPNAVLAEEILQATFKNHPVRYDIGGYEDTISKITQEDLYTCYQTFYDPSNMTLVAAGNFDQEKVLSWILENPHLQVKKEAKTVSRKIVSEPSEVLCKYKEINFSNLVIPKIALNVKLSLKNKKDHYEYFLYIYMFLSILFGSTSKFREDMLKKKLFASFRAGSILIDEYMILEFSCDTHEPKKLADEIIACLKSETILEEDFNRCKKVQIASLIMNSDSTEFTVEDIVNDWISFDQIIEDKIEKIKKLEYSKLIKIREKLNFDNHSIVIMNKEK